MEEKTIREELNERHKEMHQHVDELFGLLQIMAEGTIQNPQTAVQIVEAKWQKLTRIFTETKQKSEEAARKLY